MGVCVCMGVRVCMCLPLRVCVHTDNSKRANIIKLLTLGGAEQISRPPQTRSPSPDTATATCPPDATGPGRLPAGRRAIPAHATARPPAAAVGDEITDADPPSEVVLVGEGLKGDEYDALVDRWGVSPTKLDWVKDSVSDSVCHTACHGLVSSLRHSKFRMNSCLRTGRWASMHAKMQAMCVFLTIM